MDVKRQYFRIIPRDSYSTRNAKTTQALRKEEKEKNMEWNRSETLALARTKCVYCEGSGLRQMKKQESAPCNCVLRGIFRICYNRFKYCATKEKYLSKVSLEHTSRTSRAGTWSRKDEEYVADFMLIAKRTLTDDEHRIFRFHFLLGADWKLCCRKLKLDKGDFFHTVYRIQQKLGRAFRETEPYGLFPLDEYFSGSTKTQTARVIPIRPEGSRLRAFLIEAARVFISRAAFFSLIH
jgi:hypothetical protein